MSASLNYTLNRVVVFRSADSVSKTASCYAALATAMLAVNTLVVAFLAGVAELPPLLAKMMVEAALYVASWAIQHRVVFVRKEQAYA